MTDEQTDDPDNLKLHEREAIPGRRPEQIIVSGDSANKWIKYKWNFDNTTERHREKNSLTVDLLDMR